MEPESDLQEGGEVSGDSTRVVNEDRCEVAMASNLCTFTARRGQILGNATLGGSNPLMSPLPPAQPIQNWISPPLTEKQLTRLRSVRAPPGSTLPPPSGSGRFRALRLNGTKSGSIDPRWGVSYRFTGTSPTDLVGALRGLLIPMGFKVTWPPETPSPFMLAVATKGVPHHEGTEISGQVFLERNVGVDHAATRRKNRLPWIGLIASVTAASVLMYLAITRYTEGSYSLLAYPAGLAFFTAMASGMSFADADYWSDVVVASYRVRIPQKVTMTEALQAIGDYEVQFQAVRALSQDWESQYSSGRSVKASTLDPALEDVRQAIEGAFGSHVLS